MWTLKENIKIILRQQGLIITQETLANDQSLADIILNDPVYNARYGHNLVKKEDSTGRKNTAAANENENVIEVNIKKKADALKEQMDPQHLFADSALTFDNAGNDGMVLNVKEREPRSKSSGSKQSNLMEEKDDSQQKS